MWQRMVRRLSARRPADVYVPHWGLHGPAAFDLAVTAGLRHGTLHHLLSEAHKPVWDYEARKCSHLQTQELCSAQGIQFVPLVVESRGSWGPTAVKTWLALAQATAAQSGEAVSVEASRLYEMLAVTLQRENARAVLRRLPDPAPVSWPRGLPCCTLVGHTPLVGLRLGPSSSAPVCIIRTPRSAKMW